MVEEYQLTLPTDFVDFSKAHALNPGENGKAAENQSVRGDIIACPFKGRSNDSSILENKCTTASDGVTGDIVTRNNFLFVR